MIIKEVLAQLENQNTDRPAIKIYQKGEGYKIIVMAFKKGMILKEHATPIPAKLLVLEGKVNYKEASRNLVLDKLEELEIPINVIHAVTALENSICLLIQGE